MAHAILAREPAYDKFPQGLEAHDLDQGQPQEQFLRGRMRLEPFQGLPLSELHLPLLLAEGSFQNFLDLRMWARICHRIKHAQYQTFTDRHLERHVLAPASAHHPRREEHDRPVGLSRLLSEKGKNSQDLLNVGKLLARLL